MSDSLSTQPQQLLLSATGPTSDSLDLESVIVEILSWLPTKSLIRFRCVSKAWRSLISDPYFIKKHLTRRINSNPSFIVQHFSGFDSGNRFTLFNYSGPVSTRELDFPVIDLQLDSIDFVGSCNGLLCLLLYYKTSIFMLWNPCTGESKVLPPIGSRPHLYGFGYDSTTDDYKVIVGTYDMHSTEYVVAFALKTGSWRKLQSLNQSFRFLRRGCFVNQALYWVVDERDEDRRVIASKLVSFDLAEEKFHENAFYPIEGLVARVQNVRNSLTFYYGPDVYSARALDFTFRMWVVEENGAEKSWNQVMEIPSEALPEDDHCLKPVCIFDDGVALIQVTWDDYECRSFLTLYNPKEKSCRNITEPSTFETAAYIETLVSPLTGGGV